MPPANACAAEGHGREVGVSGASLVSAGTRRIGCFHLRNPQAKYCMPVPRKCSTILSTDGAYGRAPFESGRRVPAAIQEQQRRNRIVGDVYGAAKDRPIASRGNRRACKLLHTQTNKC